MLGAIAGWVGKTVAVAVGKTIAFGMYDEIKESNKKSADYDKFVGIMEKTASERKTSCKADELSRDCPQSAKLPHYHQEGMTTHGPFGNEIKGGSGSDTLRIYTVVGRDGQIINAQGFDLSKTVQYTVRHQDGTFETERLNADEATKRIQREAAFPNPNDRL